MAISSAEGTLQASLKQGLSTVLLQLTDAIS